MKKRNWYRTSRYSITVMSTHSTDQKGYTRIHDFLHGWGLVHPSGKSISWDSGWRPPTKRLAAKLDKRLKEALSKPIMFPIIKNMPPLPSLLKDLVSVQPMMEPLKGSKKI